MYSLYSRKDLRWRRGLLLIHQYLTQWRSQANRKMPSHNLILKSSLRKIATRPIEERMGIGRLESRRLYLLRMRIYFHQLEIPLAYSTGALGKGETIEKPKGWK
jgi:hypothetical protein